MSILAAAAYGGSNNLPRLLDRVAAISAVLVANARVDWEPGAMMDAYDRGCYAGRRPAGIGDSRALVCRVCPPIGSTSAARPMSAACSGCMPWPLHGLAAVVAHKLQLCMHASGSSNRSILAPGAWAVWLDALGEKGESPSGYILRLLSVHSKRTVQRIGGPE
jgi:hypothetical protein